MAKFVQFYYIKYNFLFRSESPTQAFFQMLKVIDLECKDLGAEELGRRLEHYVISYDNMCHVDSLRVATSEFPLSENLKKIWIKVKKIIDRLHLRNHKNDVCQTKYNADKILGPNTYNTLAAEQLFSWASRFKK